MAPRLRAARRAFVLGAAFAIGLAGRSAHAGPLPRLAVSLPTGTDIADLVRTLQAQGIEDTVIVLPPVRLGIGTLSGPAAGTSTRVPGSGSLTVAQGVSPASGRPPSGASVFLRLVLDIGEMTGATTRDRESEVERRVREIVDALALGAFPIKGLVIELPGVGPSPEIFQFTIATLTVMVRAVTPGLHVSLMLPPSALPEQADRARRLSAYADSLVVAGDTFRSAPSDAGTPVTVHLDIDAGGPPSEAPRVLLDFLVTSAARSPDMLWIEAPTLQALRSLATSLQFLNRSLAGGFEMTTPERAPAAVLLDGQPATPAVAFVGSHTADVAVLVKTGATPTSPRQLGLAATSTTDRLSCHDAAEGRSLPAPTASTCRADAAFVLVRVARASGDERLFEAVSVKGRADLRVEEIIARWQAAWHAERRLLQNYSVPCLLGLHFEAGGALSVAFDVALDLQEYADANGLQEWVQTGFFINGVRFRRGSEFPLPMLEPDKVVARPLELSLDEKYGYRLLGVENVDGTLCYVVAIEPASEGETLYAGKVWIDGVGFRQIRLQLEQRTGKNNVAAHVETQEFARARDAEGREFMLLRSIRAQDTINLAGRSVIVEKAYRFGAYAINTPDFAARLDAARSSNDPMYKDTAEGLRAFRKDGQARVVEPLSGKRVRSLVGGMMYDGSLGFPVPLAGLSWLDFKFRGTDSQLSVFFAGLFLDMNLSRQWNKNLRTGVDLEVSALPGSDRVFSGSQELEGLQVRWFEQWATGRVDWSVSTGWNLTASAGASLRNYQATSKTDPRFKVPPTAVTFRASGEAKYTRRGFTFDGKLEQAAPVGGGAYGYSDDPQGPTSSAPYRLYSAEISQHLFVGKLTRGGVSASYFGGDHLDRFARYKPSLMSRPKMRGIPSGTESFDDVALAGAFYGFNVLDLFKVEGTFNHAWARNRGESNRFRQFDGVDGNIGIAGPWSTYIQASVGVVLRGNLERYRSRWDTYILIFKPLRR